MRVHPLVLLLGFILGLFLFITALRILIRILWPISFFILLAALLVNGKVVMGYGRWLLDMIRSRPVAGILGVLGTLVFFPFVTIFLLIKAIDSRKSDKSGRLKKGEYITYEEVDDDFLDLTELKDRKKRIDETYGDLLK